MVLCRGGRPRRLVADRPGHALCEEYDLPPLAPDEVRVRSIFSSTKHGTEMRAFRADSADATDAFDGELRLHNRGHDVTGNRFPMGLGERYVGEVIEVGPQAGAHAQALLPNSEFVCSGVTVLVNACRRQRPGVPGRFRPPTEGRRQGVGRR